MPSTFTWLDYSEQERRRMLDVIELFGERTTRDELGIGAVRDAFADQLFPGTSTIQTRAKYFLFVPWVYLLLERKQTPSASVEGRARKMEIDLIGQLGQSDDTVGVIGRLRKENLQRLPSSIYWQGLLVWGIRRFPGSQDEYYREFDGFHARCRERYVGRAGFEGEAESEPDLANWDPGLPPIPDGFPTGATLALSAVEAGYLREQILSHCPQSLLAVLVRTPITLEGVEYGWQLTDPLPPHLRELLDHGQNFSESLHGAQLLYNLMLAEQVHREDWIGTYRNALQDWWLELRPRSSDLSRWDLSRFWDLVSRVNPRISPRARTFVNEWVRLLRGAKAESDVVEGPAARELVDGRERQLKGSLARLGSERARETWQGMAGAARLDLRWRSARRIVGDIRAVLEGRADARA